jgi:sensor c-di-GMP phosphodiesterase-like protein
LRSPSRTWTIFAIVVGAVAAGAPVLAFNWWLKSHGEDEASLTATWALGHAEAQIGQAISAITDLSGRGVDSCKPPNIEAMRRAAIQTGPVKELALIGANGQIVCSDTGVQNRPQVIVTIATANRDFMLDLVRVADERFVRVRKMGHLDKPAIAALVPASLLLPQVSIHGGPLSGSVRLMFAGGAQIAEAGPPQGGAPEQHYARQRSQAYGISAAVTLPHSGLIASHDSLNRIGVVVTGTVAIVILLFTFVILVRSKRPRKPIANLVRAILAEEFVPFYQPVVDIQTGKLVSAEVLVRWRKPKGKFLEPEAFAPLVESSGLAVDLTRSVMRRVREEVGSAIGKRPHVSIAFNIAPEHFDDALILNDVGTIFDSSPVKLTQMLALPVPGRRKRAHPSPFEPMRITSSSTALPSAIGSDDSTWRCSGGFPTSVQSVRPSDAMTESSLTGAAANVAWRMASRWGVRQESMPRAARSSSVEITRATRFSASAMCRRADCSSSCRPCRSTRLPSQ